MWIRARPIIDRVYSMSIKTSILCAMGLSKIEQMLTDLKALISEACRTSLELFSFHVCTNNVMLELQLRYCCAK